MRWLLLILLLSPSGAWACGVSAQAPFRVLRASAGADEAVTISFLGHASFEIETPAGVRAVTDHNGYNVPKRLPDVVTMNHAHATHYVDHPDPGIAHVLRGWGTGGAPAKLDLTVRDLRVRNLPTNIRDGRGGTEYYGNSVFIFEAAGLCIAHLSHLHHLLTPEDLADLGPIDVLMLPVDGIWTLSHADAAEVLDQIHARLVIPMHYFGMATVRQFLAGLGGRYPVITAHDPTIRLSRASLPLSTEILVLPGDRY